MPTPAKPNESGFIVILVPLIIIIVILVLVFGGKDKPKTSYEATVQDYSVIDPATLRVNVKVKNTGEEPGKPSCTIKADNGNGSYKGYDVFVAEEDVKPGLYWTLPANLTITNEGAVHVKEVTVECK